jgi:hypothetical protein
MFVLPKFPEIGWDAHPDFHQQGNQDVHFHGDNNNNIHNHMNQVQGEE